MTRRVVTTTDVRAWERAYDEGRTINAIAVDFGRGYHTIRIHLAPSGRVGRSKTNARTAKTQRVLELLADGVEPWAISERVGVTRSRIAHIKWESRRSA